MMSSRQIWRPAIRKLTTSFTFRLKCLRKKSPWKIYATTISISGYVVQIIFFLVITPLFSWSENIMAFHCFGSRHKMGSAYGT